MPLDYAPMLSLLIRPPQPSAVADPDVPSGLELYTDDSGEPYTDEHDEAYSV